MKTTVSRRQFLITGAALSGGLLVGCGKPSASDRLGAGSILSVEGGEVALNGWVKIAPDGKVTVAVPRSEMGQGVLTSLPMLLVEELDARWEDVKVEQAPVAQIYANATMMLNVVPFASDDDGVLARMVRASMQRLGYALSLQVTGGSASIRDAWEPLRLAGATARAMLVEAAAKRWSVQADQCRVEAGQVINVKSGARLGFGELAKDAATLTPPQDVRFKDPGQYKLIGKPMPRQDIPPKTDGSAVFGIDVKVDGMVYAAIAQPPVFGAKVASVDDKAALQRKGVLKVLRIPQGVVVVANNWWRAKQALGDLKITYEPSPHDQYSSAEMRKQYETELAANKGFAYGTKGNTDEALKQAAKVIEATYWAPLLAHAAMEPMNCVVKLSADACEIWNGEQFQSIDQPEVAAVLGMKPEQVKLNMLFAETCSTMCTGPRRCPSSAPPWMARAA
ncbi:MAG: xanthine dehydrogenase family protein molybdopterin-binding subunit [Aquabacterium sp.]|nr:xanthine dehydrogenase family protein molybdopterin-binding subunit [Aquabacterium sp.]